MFEVSVATVVEREAACRLLVSHRPPTERTRAAARYRELLASQELDPAGLFVAKHSHDTICGAILVSVMPGALGLAWPPAVERAPDRIATEDALVAAACGWLKTRGVKVCQAFGGDWDRASFAALERARFRNLTRLVELRCDRLDEPAATSRLTFEEVHDTNRDAFMACLIATFEGSLDCPEVTGSRTDAELLATYTDSECPDESWFLAKWEAEQVGVVMLEPSAEAGEIELMYLGVIPNFRSRGHGAELVCFARQKVRKSGGIALVLSVDERNLPARRLYETRGFQACGMRSVFLADWPPIS